MAFSSLEGKALVRDWLEHVGKPLGFKTFLDIGCGAGLYGKIIREVFGKSARIRAVEIFEEYSTRYNLKDIYDEIVIEDIRYYHPLLFPYDLIMAGDVLEHMTKEDAIKVVKELRPKCRFLLAALPVKIDRPWSTGYNQLPVEWEENPSEQHLYQWTGEEIQESFKPMWLVPFIATGTFLIEGGVR